MWKNLIVVYWDTPDGELKTKDLTATGRKIEAIDRIIGHQNWWGVECNTPEEALKKYADWQKFLVSLKSKASQKNRRPVQLNRRLMENKPA